MLKLAIKYGEKYKKIYIHFISLPLNKIHTGTSAVSSAF